MLVKRLVSIEDLGNITLLFTDKTGTLTDGHITFNRALDATGGRERSRRDLLGLVCNEAVLDDGHAVSGNALDVALWNAPGGTDVATDGRGSGTRRAAAVRPRAPAVDRRRRRAGRRPAGSS